MRQQLEQVPNISCVLVYVGIMRLVFIRMRKIYWILHLSDHYFNIHLPRHPIEFKIVLILTSKSG